MGHNDLEHDKSARNSTKPNYDSNEMEANKENSEIKRSIRLHKEKSVQDYTTNNSSSRGLKRPACSTVEIQYVSSESKLDAPGKLGKLFVYIMMITL